VLQHPRRGRVDQREERRGEGRLRAGGIGPLGGDPDELGVVDQTPDRAAAVAVPVVGVVDEVEVGVERIVDGREARADGPPPAP
jgi:hypothetical protein